MTTGEDRDLAIQQVNEALERVAVEAEVTLPRYDTPSYTGLVYQMEKYYPTWTLEEDHLALRCAVDVYKQVFRKDPAIGRWTFSTNGVAIMGLHGVPCFGFGPGNEIYAHSVEEQIPVEHLVKAAVFYAIFPTIFAQWNSK